MTGADAAPAVALAGLDRERLLGKGGQGEVWAIRGAMVNGSWPVAYKQYAPDSLREADTAALDAMVRFVPSLEAAAGRWLCEHTAWPAALVEDADGTVRGFLMRQVPQEYVRRLATRPDKPEIAGVEFLLNPRPYLDRIGIDLGDRQRLQLLMNVAGLLDGLHRLGVAVGDLSPKNLLFTLDPQPSCFFIDCDAMALGGRSVLRQTETPGWELPIGEPLATPAGDRFKFSLLAVRLFLGDQEDRDVAALAAVSPRLGELARLGLSATPGERPPLREWLGELEPALSRVPARPAAPHFAPAVPGAAAPAGRPAPATPLAAPQPLGQRGTVPRQGRAGVTAVLVLVAVIVAVVLGVGLTHSGGTSAPPDPEAIGAQRTTDTDTSQADPAAQAAALDALLRQQAGTRGHVQQAVNSAMKCGRGTSLTEDTDAFRHAYGRRDDLTTQLSGLDVDAVDGGGQAVSDLTDAWNASMAADRAFAQWASWLATNGCDADTTANAPGFSDAMDASARATEAKKTFVAEWNPVADRYGLPDYSWDQL
ncbi:hypothetical protein [Actinacidiphila acididurans]|uniref:Protein kinase domain-containing protein n=1 Tax=Actinacidiphila acididurans TaxID=2784346 RepID=A0ABS2U205_9ACTN|nr:hypothetical protein [Actinacidiphila acididurans]MBM9509643.1 hypothetical protein [Actinacidiphila acididurans]